MSLPPHDIASNLHGSYCVPTASRNRPAAKTVLAGKVWEPRTLQFMAANCGDGDVVHAGTYFGDFLPALSHALAPDARLWAFEPSTENHACAAHTVALNGLKNVSLFHAGLGADTGRASLHIVSPRGALGGSSTIVREKRPRRSYEEIGIVALDDVVVDRAVTVLQLDVEGYEQKALRGARGLLERCKPLLILESLPANQRHILRIGYRLLGTVHGNSVLTASTNEPTAWEACRDQP
jgi:FkbM family methyltransferase